MLADLRDATRQIRRRSLVSAGIVAIIAIAVATNTALFAVVDGLLLKPLPYRDSERLVSLRLPLPNAQRLTSADRIRLREAVEQTALLADRAVEGPGGLFDGQGDLTLINSAVSSNFFELLGVRPAFGNSLPADDQPGEGVPTVVIGDTLWRTRFGADPAIVGRPTVLDGRHVVVAGVMPPGFAFPRGTNIWSPVGPFQRQALPSVARLADGVTIDGVRKALSPVEVRPLREAVRPRGGLTLVLLLAGSAFLLLIGWTQVAALQLARFPARSREVGVRLALGASRTRLIRQFAVEGVVLSVGALAVAWPLASGLTDAVATLLPPEMMRGQQVPTDVRVFLFACGLSAAGVMACAVGPAAWLIRHPVADSLKGEGFARRGRPIGWRLRRVLITGQLAVTALLLYMAGLAAHAFVSVEYVDLGFQPAGLFVVSPPGLPLGGSPEARILRRQEYVRNLLDTLREVPGIEGAAGATTYPLRQFGVAAGLSLPNVADWAPTTVRMNQVTTDYFRVLRLRFLEGREPAESRGAGEAVVNQTLARALAVHGPVVGQQIVLAGFRARVVGVVEDCVNERPDAVREPEVYVSVWSPSLVVVRVDGSPTARARLQSVADRVAYPEAGGTVRSVEEERRRANTGYRARMLLLAVLAGVGMLLAVLGVAGALYDEIRQQTRDIAIRAALGAEAADIGWQVLRRPVLCAVCAAVGGSAVGAPLGHAARSLLFDVSGFDVVTAVAVSGVLTAVALAAGYPALRQAVAVDPATALRHE